MQTDVEALLRRRRESSVWTNRACVLRIDGDPIAYEMTPAPLPRTTLFVPGNLASRRWWQPTREALLSGRTRSHPEHAMVIVEWRGLGASQPVSRPRELTLERLALDLIAVANSIEAKEVDIVGHSTGGLLAMLAALAAPDRVRRLALLDPVPLDGLQLADETIEAFGRMASDPALTAAIMRGTIHGAAPEDPLIEAIIADTLRVDPWIWQGVPSLLGGFDASAAAQRLRQEVLIVHGCEDKVLPLEGSRRLARMLPTARLVEVAGAGHSLNVEDPARLLSLLLPFLGRDGAI